MEAFWTDVGVSGGIILGAMLAGAAALHTLAAIGGVGRRMTDWLARAPGLDLAVTYFTAAPLIVGPSVWGWAGLLGAIAGQVLAVLFWCRFHELAHHKELEGSRIVSHINARFGRFRGHAALWSTTLAVPLFWLVRLTQYVAYPPLVWLVNFPRYKEGEWINVSRHKFQGLVGHDRIWCLYCDWMTGVWCLGSEMLRNVESFWCPIRFGADAKCANCAIDFPDLEGGWVQARGTMADVGRVLDERYPDKSNSSWFGHPSRLTSVTVNGEETSDAASR